MKEIDKKTLYNIIEQISTKLKGHTKKINIFCVGGTALTLINKKYSSTDIDFVVHREDFTTITSITGEMEYKEKIRIDVGNEFVLGGDGIEYSLPSDFKECSKKICSFGKLNLYVISELDILITKILAGRRKDYHDIGELIKKNKPEEIIKRFEQYEFPASMKKELENKLKQFIGKNS